MTAKITWWPARLAEISITVPEFLLARYDWPDQRLYQFCQYIPGRKPTPWTDGKGNGIQTPDYCIDAANVTEFIRIPPEREYTYKPKVGERNRD